MLEIEFPGFPGRRNTITSPTTSKPAKTRTRLTPKAAPKKNRLPLLLVLAGVGLLVVAVWALWGGGRARPNIGVSGAPRQEVEQQVYDYGDVRLGTPVRTEVRLANTGGGELTFTQAPYVEVKEGC